MSYLKAHIATHHLCVSIADIATFFPHAQETRVGNKQARQATALCLSCLRIDTRGRLSCLLEGLKSLCLLACLQAACHSAYTKSWHSVVVHPPPNPSISSSNVSNVAFSRCVTSSVFSYDWCEGKGGLGGGQKVLIRL